MIQSVTKQYNSLNIADTYKVILINGEVLFVPHNEANRHYQEILEWVAAGNIITDPGE